VGEGGDDKIIKKMKISSTLSTLELLEGSTSENFLFDGPPPFSTTRLPNLFPLSTSPPLLPTLSPNHSPYLAKTLGSFCNWWAENKVEELPYICHQFLQVPSNQLNQLLSHSHSEEDTLRQGNKWIHYKSKVIDQDDNPFFSGRSISLVGILGGVIFILLLIAFITCIRQRRNYQQHNDILHHHVLSQLRHARQVAGDGQVSCGSESERRVPPPSYTAVIKLKEEEDKGLPTYSVALKRKQNIDHQSLDDENAMSLKRESDNNGAGVQHIIVERGNSSSP